MQNSSSSTLLLRSGNSMPLIGLGTWQLSIDTADTIKEALALGYAMIDTSGDYGTQRGVGEGIRNSDVDRTDVYVVTKIEETDVPLEAVRENLDELQMEYADLILLHRPPPEGMGEELWRGLIEARDQGYARDIGVSNYSSELIDELVRATGEVPAVNQIEWSPFGHSEEMRRYAEGRGIVLQAYSPLTRGIRLDDSTLMSTATRYGKSPAQILIRWNIEQGIAPIPKANQIAHLRENIDVFDFELDPADMRELERLNEHYSALGTLAYV